MTMLALSKELAGVATHTATAMHVCGLVHYYSSHASRALLVSCLDRPDSTLRTTRQLVRLGGIDGLLLRSRLPTRHARRLVHADLGTGLGLHTIRLDLGHRILVGSPPPSTRRFGNVERLAVRAQRRRNIYLDRAFQFEPAKDAM